MCVCVCEKEKEKRKRKKKKKKEKRKDRDRDKDKINNDNRPKEQLKQKLYRLASVKSIKPRRGCHRQEKDLYNSNSE